MSELRDQITRMLSQSQGFAGTAPLEAVARAQLAQRTAVAALPRLHGEELSEIHALLAIAKSRVERYQAGLAAWSESVRERQELFTQHERERLQNPIPTKG